VRYIRYIQTHFPFVCISYICMYEKNNLTNRVMFSIAMGRRGGGGGPFVECSRSLIRATSLPLFRSTVRVIYPSAAPEYQKDYSTRVQVSHRNHLREFRTEAGLHVCVTPIHSKRNPHLSHKLAPHPSCSLLPCQHEAMGHDGGVASLVVVLGSCC